MWSDDRIHGVISTRLNAIFGLNDEDGLSFESNRSTIRKAIEKDWYKSAPETELKRLYRWGLLLGIGVAWRTVVKVEDKRWVPVLKAWHPRFLQMNFTTMKWELVDDTGKTWVVDPKKDPNWVLFHPYGEQRPWFEGLWKPLSLLWLVKNHAQRTWARHNDLYGIMTAGLPEGKSTKDADSRSFWTSIQSLGRNARILLPHGYTLDTLEVGANTWETFPQTIEKMDTGMAITVMGNPLTTEVRDSVQTGANAASAVRQDYLEFDAEVLSTWAHDVHLPAWAEWNFGDSGLAPYLVYKTEPSEDVSRTANTWKMLGESLALLKQWEPEGKQIDLEQVFERFRVPVMKQSEQEQQEDEPAPQDRMEPQDSQVPQEENEEQ